LDAIGIWRLAAIAAKMVRQLCHHPVRHESLGLALAVTMRGGEFLMKLVLR